MVPTRQEFGCGPTSDKRLEAACQSQGGRNAGVARPHVDGEGATRRLTTVPPSHDHRVEYMATEARQDRRRRKPARIDLSRPAERVRLATQLHEMACRIEAISKLLRPRMTGHQPPSSPNPTHPLTDTEQYILDDLGSATMRGTELAAAGSYTYDAHFRTILANLCKRNIIGKGPHGYYRLPPRHDSARQHMGIPDRQVGSG